MSSQNSLFTVQRVILLLLISAVTLSVADSCRHVITYQGKSKVISRKTDHSLADSVRVFGKVVSVDDTLSSRIDARIWSEAFAKEAHSDIRGAYSLTIPSGTYTLKCNPFAGFDEFQETIKITALPNEKIEINFYIGSKIE